ncbi:enoyl-CoA hydratase-related protein [Rhodococcus erythropolis]|uniref:enoyl-CoA hydratase-related protein n=1 Tax=Rhodococcus erythropolis TaxID=1833 RepID=UPI00049271BF|nr:enoyl-CoA hydratase-related protein [Rhodococcus erythropolis]ALU73318.1 enoyl-CoA hydratase [Rhodococcus erythropolis R138]MCQ4128282.1 enoyl-CoA hydratase-related protein [Rhodococcus erythropolis]
MTDNEPAGQLVQRERLGAVELLTLNRPDHLNAWTADLEEEYFAALEECERDAEVRAIVVTGAGRGFCAGADIHGLKGASESGTVRAPGRLPLQYPLSLGTPLIAAINGAAAGIGLVQALYCDVRFIAPEAKVTTAFAKRGLIAEYGIAWLLPRIIGTSRALDLLLSSRVVTGQEAHAIGLADFVVPPDALVDTAVRYATTLATSCSPTSMRTMKSQVRDGLDTDFTTAVRRSEIEMAASFAGADFTEGVTSFLERRAPQFAPLTSAH